MNPSTADNGSSGGCGWSEKIEELWGTKPKQWSHRKPTKSWRIEAAILRLLTASSRSFTNAFRQQWWHRDDRHCTSFRSVPTLASGVAGNGNGNGIRVGFEGRVDGSFPKAFQWRGWHGEDRNLTSFRLVPTLAGGVAGNINEIRVGFKGSGRSG